MIAAFEIFLPQITKNHSKEHNYRCYSILLMKKAVMAVGCSRGSEQYFQSGSLRSKRLSANCASASSIITRNVAIELL